MARHSEADLESLLESATHLHSSPRLDEVLAHVLRSVMGRLMVRRALIALESNGEMRVFAARGTAGPEPGALFERPRAEAAGFEHFFVIGEAARPLGWLALGAPHGGEPGEGQRAYLDALLGLAASAVTNARSLTEAQQQSLRLRTSLELLRGVSAERDPMQIARSLGLTLAGQFGVSKVAVAVWQVEQPTLWQAGLELGEPAAFRSEMTALAGPSAVDRLPEGVSRKLLGQQQVSWVVPIVAQQETIGFAALGPSATLGELRAEHIDLAAGLAEQAGLALANAWKAKLEEDLDLAAEIQQQLLPRELPPLPGFEIAHGYRPARKVSGDYFDVLQPTGSDTAFLCLADVTGKAASAAIAMSYLAATFRLLVGLHQDLSELLARANRLIREGLHGGKSATAAVVALEPTTGACRFCSAGHDPAFLLRRDGTTEELGAVGEAFPLGAVDPELLPASYREQRFELGPGDVLVLYSDGVSEAQGGNGEELGRPRLRQHLEGVRGAAAQEIVDSVLAEIEAFTGGAAQYDDITLLVLRRVRP